MTASV